MFRKVEDFRKGTLYSAECDLADWDELCDELIYKDEQTDEEFEECLAMVIRQRRRQKDFLILKSRSKIWWFFEYVQRYVF